jgi:hypothetical protein
LDIVVRLRMEDGESGENERRCQEQQPPRASRKLPDRARPGSRAGRHVAHFLFPSEELTTGSYDGTVRLWHPVTGTQLGDPLTGPVAGITNVALSDGRTLLATGSNDVRLWGPALGRQQSDGLRVVANRVGISAFRSEAGCRVSMVVTVSRRHATQGRAGWVDSGPGR